MNLCVTWTWNVSWLSGKYLLSGTVGPVGLKTARELTQCDSGLRAQAPSCLRAAELAELHLECSDTAAGDVTQAVSCVMHDVVDGVERLRAQR